MGYCRFKIVADGLVFTKTSYAKVVPSETSMLEFLAGNYTLSDAEKTNLEKRKRLKVKSYPLEELPFIYRTQKFMLWKTRRIIEVAEYLLQVLRLAEKIVKSSRKKQITMSKNISTFCSKLPQTRTTYFPRGSATECKTLTSS